MLELKHAQFKVDFKIKEYQQVEFAVLIVIEACAQLLSEAFPGTVDDLTEVERATLSSPRWTYIVAFMRDWAFLFLDHRRAVRANESAALTQVYIEAWSFMITGTANQTNYRSTDTHSSHNSTLVLALSPALALSLALTITIGP
jgi:hypothetical protein